MSSSYLNIPAAGSASWRNPVATAAELPLTNNVNGDAIVTQDTDTIYIWNGSAWVATGGGGGGSGTVTSVAMSVPSALLAVTGSPITTAGTLAVTLPTQTANKVFASPDGSTGTPSFRALVAADVPTLNQNTTGTAANITATSNSTLTTLSALSLPTSQLSGTLGIANGGTGQTTANSALNALLPTQTSNSGKVLTTDGSNTSWTTSNVLSNITTSTSYFCDMDVNPLQYGFASSSSNGSLNYNTYPWTGDTLSIGVVSMNATAVSGYYFLTQSSNNTFGTQNLNNKTITVVARAALSAVPDNVTANYIATIGMMNVTGSATVEASNGIYFYASNASANWICKTAKGGTRTSTDSGVPLTTSFFKFQATGTSSQIQFYINGSLVATHTTNIPTNTNETITLATSIQSQATNYTPTKSIYIDYLGSQTTIVSGSR